MSPVGFELTNEENQRPKTDALPHVHSDRSVYVQYMFQIYALIKVQHNIYYYYYYYYYYAIITCELKILASLRTY